jgi:ATP-binding cassette subfamily F protein 1
MNPLDIYIDNVSISIFSKQLLKDTKLHLIYGRKYGLIGPNGCGKTTLLNYIVESSFNINVFLCEQDIQIDKKENIVNVLIKSDKKRLLLLERLKNEDELKQTYEELNAIKAYSIEARVKKILHGLGFTEEMMEKSIDYFSGGWRMRVSLARALVIEPTVLLLDEPTNHLDSSAITWLTEYLQKYKKTLLLVSHDVNFINDICTDIIHINEKTLNYYTNVTYYAFLKILNQNKKNLRKKLLKKYKLREYAVNFTFLDPQCLGHGSILSLEDVYFGYGNDILLREISISISLDTRIAITSANGMGKSTLLKLLSGELIPQSGTRECHQRLNIGQFNQHSESQLNFDESAVDYIKNKYLLSFENARKMLGQFGLDGKSHATLIRNLSGGQKSRVALVDLANGIPDVLLLDEPTNNLDMDCIDALIKGINNFKGAVIIVSHCEDLIARTNCEIWTIRDKRLLLADD